MPEAQTKPGNGLTWDNLIPKDHGVQLAWVMKQECKLMERSLPWRQDPEDTWFRDPSPSLENLGQVGPDIVPEQEPDEQVQAGH